MRLEPARSRRNLQSYCSARLRTQTYHSRARGYKKAVSSSSLIIDGGSGGAGRSGAGGGQADSGRVAEAAGVELARTSGWWQDWTDPDSTVQWSWRRTSGPGSTAEQKYRSRTLHTQTCRSIIIQYASGWEVASCIIQLACRWKHVTSQQGVRRVVKCSVPRASG